MDDYATFEKLKWSFIESVIVIGSNYLFCSLNTIDDIVALSITSSQNFNECRCTIVSYYGLLKPVQNIKVEWSIKD